MRQLTVIVFTDVVGYSGMMQRDEPLALRLLEEHWELVRAVLPAFGGSEVKTIGDAFLLEFASALSAVKCAVEIQRRLHERNYGKDPAQQVRLRVGIHLGDVERRDGDLFGDGVNVAARVQGQAPEGGICVSEPVYAQVRTQGGELSFVAMGARELKNISSPIALYSVTLPWQDQRAKKKAPVRRIAMAAAFVAIVAVGGLVAPRLLPLVSSPAAATENSIAVLPFVDMSPAHDQEYFSDGLAEQLLDQLAKVSDLRVAARTSAFSFKGKNEDLRQIGKSLGVRTVLEGSVRKAGDQIRITAQLIDVTSGYHVWSETYDRQLTDIFHIQDDIAGKVVDSLKVKLLAGKSIGSAQAGHVPPIEAYELMLKARHALQYEDTAKAIEYAQQALAADPQYALALTILAQAKFDWADSEEDDLARAMAGRAEALSLAEKAVAMDPSVAATYAERAVLRLYINYDAKGAEADLAKALEISPADAGVLAKYVDTLAGKEELDKSVETARKVVLLDPLNAFAWTALGRFLACQGKYAEAQDMLNHALQLNPASQRAIGFLVYLAVLQGKPDLAGPLLDRVTDPMSHTQAGALLAYATGHADAGDTAMKQMVDQFAVSSAYQIAEVYALTNRKDEAFRWLNRAYDQRDGGIAIVKVDMMFSTLHGDPRWEAFKTKIGRV